MFKYYNQFIDAEQNGLDVLILDEAHRIKETSTNRYTRASLRTGRPQVEELIDAARVPVFLLDEHQVVRPSERGTVAEIEGAALSMGCKVTHVDLDGQFRCGGSRAYEMWVLRLLGLEPGGPIGWMGDDAFELSVAAKPSMMEQRLERLLGEGYSARMAAGYCWKWRDPVKGADVLPEDVVIGDWKKPWNNKRDTSFAGAPGTPYWAIDPAGFNQVGCVYTAQGFEYDYGGVIIGPDLVWRSDHWVVRPHPRMTPVLAPGLRYDVPTGVPIDAGDESLSGLPADLDTCWTSTGWDRGRSGCWVRPATADDARWECTPSGVPATAVTVVPATRGSSGRATHRTDRSTT